MSDELKNITPGGPPVTVDRAAVKAAQEEVEKSAKALREAALDADAAAEQLQWAALGEAPAFEEGLLLPAEENRKRYTAQRAQQNEIRRNACLYMLARKCPVEDIAHILKMNLRTIRALAELNGHQLAEFSEKYAQELLAGAGAAFALAQTKMGDASYLQLVTGGGIMVDKAEKVKALAGQASGDAEAIDASAEDPALKSAREWVGRLKSAKAPSTNIQAPENNQTEEKA